MFAMLRWTLPAAAAMLGVGVSVGAHAAPLDKLGVQLTLANQVVLGDADVSVDVAITNTSGHAVNVPKWQLPSSDTLHGPLFVITKEDGTPARYVGPLVTRGAPRAADLVRIEAGATLNYRVDLTRDYQLGNGRYTIEYASGGRHESEATVASIAPLYLWTEGRTVKAERPAETNAGDRPVPEAASITYTGACTASEKSRLVSAVNAATGYATSASSYLGRRPQGTQRFEQWFGNFTGPARWRTAQTHFSKIESAFKTKPLVLDCSCSDSGVYAYVFSNEPYKIYLCGAFWAAPLRGTDSKGGTLIHEMSHFTVVAATNDWAYGQSAAAALARSNPARAIDNADSHEYFAENRPFLP